MVLSPFDFENPPPINNHRFSHETRRLVGRLFFLKRGFEIDNQPGLTVGTLMDGRMDGWIDSDSFRFFI
jgi:hypothetical protein